MKKLSLLILFSVSLCGCGTQPVSRDPHEAEPVLVSRDTLTKDFLQQETEKVEPVLQPVFDFEPPSFVDRAAPAYPIISAERGREGWVAVDFMVDPSGTSYEVVVRDSSGDTYMESSSIRAIQQSTFSPALLNGEAVHSSYSNRYTFDLVMPSQNQSSNPQYRSFHAAVRESNIEEARELLNDMSRDEVFLNNMRPQGQYAYSAALLAGLEGDSLTELKFLSRAARNPVYADNTYYITDISTPYMAAFMSLVENGHYGEAANNFENMRDNPDNFNMGQKGLDTLRPTYDELLSIKDDDSTYSVEGRIDGTSYWFMTLYKSVFYFDRVEGELDELKLRCQGAYRVFPYQEGATYAIPESWGECDLQVIGSPETKFYINQQ